MKKLVHLLSNLGIEDSDSSSMRRGLRFSNRLKLYGLGLYLMYFLISIALGSSFLFWVCFSLVIAGIMAMGLSAVRWHHAANTLFLGGFSLVLFLCGNSLENGSAFELFYLVILFVYGSFDFDKQATSLLINLIFTISCILCLFLLPPYIW